MGPGQKYRRAFFSQCDSYGSETSLSCAENCSIFTFESRVDVNSLQKNVHLLMINCL